MVYHIAYTLANGKGRDSFFGLPWLSAPLFSEAEAREGREALRELGCEKLEIFAVPTADSMPEEVDWSFVGANAVAV